MNDCGNNKVLLQGKVTQINNKVIMNSLVSRYKCCLKEETKRHLPKTKEKYKALVNIHFQINFSKKQNEIQASPIHSFV